MMQEIWKDCPLHPEYEVSSQGSVRRKGKTKPLKPWVMASNKVYLMVGLGRKVRCTVHRLVAVTYLGLNPEAKEVLVCHRDDDPLNNCVSNLYLGNKSSNGFDWNRLRERRGERHPNYRHGRYVGERRRRVALKKEGMN